MRVAFLALRDFDERLSRFEEFVGPPIRKEAFQKETFATIDQLLEEHESYNEGFAEVKVMSQKGVLSPCPGMHLFKRDVIGQLRV